MSHDPYNHGGQVDDINKLILQAATDPGLTLEQAAVAGWRGILKSVLVGDYQPAEVARGLEATAACLEARPDSGVDEEVVLEMVQKAFARMMSPT